MNSDNKVMPNSLEAEQAVLASMLIDNTVAEEIISHLNPDDFYQPAHKVVLAALQNLAKKGQALDLVTLFSQLTDENNIEKAGGIEYISALVNNVPNAANADKYIEILKEKAILRNLISAGGSISSLGYEVSEDVETLIDKAQDITSNLGEAASLRRFVEPISNVLERHQEQLNKIQEENQFGSKDITGVPSGFEALDKLTNGFQKSDLIVTAGRPGMGKTAFGLSVLLNAAMAGKTCVFFSLEMSSEQLVKRLISALAHIGQKTLRTGNFTSDEIERYLEANNVLEKLPIYLDDTPAITVNQIKAKCRKLYNAGTLDIIFVDYLQIMGYAKNLQNREQQISEISRSLKGMAKEFNVPVIALAQVNRNVEKSDNKRPRLSDLRESGAIEQDADIIMFLYRDKVYNPDTAYKNVAEIIIEKHRNGEQGTAYVEFNAAYTHFDNNIPVDQKEMEALARSTIKKAKTTTSKRAGSSKISDDGEVLE